MAGRGWAQTAPRVGGTRLARGWGSVGAGWGSVGAGWGPGGAGERASVDAMRRRGQREGGGKSPIGGSPRLQWAAWRMAACVGAMRAAKRDAYKTAAMNAGGRHKRDGRGGRMRQAGQARAAGRKARSAGPQAAAAERPRGAGNIFASCVISGSSTRKRALGGKIRAPCILNRPIAPGNGCIGRGCCHLDLEKHAFRAEVARKGPFSRIRRKRDACGAILASHGPGADATREGNAGSGGRRARWGRCGRDFPMATT